MSDKDKKVNELKDLDVDRVDGVDKPATGRNFLLFKSRAAAEKAATMAGAVEQDAGEAEKKKGKSEKRVSFASVVFPTDHAVREYETAPSTDGPRSADADGDVDALGRMYSDDVLQRLGAGSGTTRFYNETPDSGAKFPDARGSDARLPKPTQEYQHANPGGGEAGGVPARVGPNYIMPQRSGIPDAGSFKAPKPAVRTLKSEQDGKLGTGMFRDVVSGPIKGSNYFDSPRDDEAVEKKGGSIWSNVVHGE